MQVCFDIMFHMINKRALLVLVGNTLFSLKFYLLKIISPNWVLFRLKSFSWTGGPACV